LTNKIRHAIILVVNQKTGVKHMTQLQMLNKHFNAGRSISNYEARDLYRIISLSRRINDLEEQGVVINRVRKTDPTGRKYVRYSKAA
jgi:DNA-binding HxlR family transcriptional regulator